MEIRFEAIVEVYIISLLGSYFVLRSIYLLPQCDFKLLIIKRYMVQFSELYDLQSCSWYFRTLDLNHRWSHSQIGCYQFPSIFMRRLSNDVKLSVYTPLTGIFKISKYNPYSALWAATFSTSYLAIMSNRVCC